MRRTTPRPTNPNRAVYKKYAEAQMTLEEILAEFKDYTIYGVLDNTSIYIVDGNKAVLLFDTIGYEDDECVPDIYEAVPVTVVDDFDYIANCYMDDCCKITKLS